PRRPAALTPTRRTLVRPTLDQAALDLLFLQARTQNGWLPTPVSDETLRRVYDIAKMGPTSANSCPARFVFSRTPAAKARLLAARAVGLDVGGMSGFDNAKVNAEFFPDGRVKSNFLCNLGHGDPTKVLPRLPRLDFDEACALL